MERSKTPWENIGSDRSSFLKNLNKSPRRIERESRVEEIARMNTKCPCDKLFCFLKKIGIALLVGVTILIIYSLLS